MNNILTRKLKKFLKGRFGGIAIGYALILTPLITYSVVAIMASDTLARTTRLNQSVQNAAVMVAKTDFAATATTATNMVNVWTNINMEPIKQYDAAGLVVAPVADAGTTQEIIHIGVEYTPSFSIANLGFRGFDSLKYGAKDNVTIERVWKPMELVFITDSSASAGSPTMIAHMSRVVEGIIDEVFRGENTSDDAWISLVTFSDYHNVGTEYARKLTTRETRKLSAPGENGSSKTQAQYDAQVNVLMQAGKGYLAEDLLQDGGPGVDMDVVCLGRPARNTFGSITEYPDVVEELKEFELYVYDGRKLNHPNGSPMYLLPQIGPYNYQSNWYPNHKEYQETETYDVTLMGVIPESWIPPGGDDERYWKPDWSNWKNPQTGRTISQASDIVSIPSSCPRMPLMVGSQDKTELMERIALIGGNVATGGDEGIAWAMRALSPNWSDIWEIDNYPAEYHSGVDKVIVFFTSYLNVGYVGAGWGNGEDGLTELYKRLEENGVRLVVFYDSQDGYYSTVAKQQHAEVENGKNNFFIPAKSDYSDVPAKLDQYIQRTYQTKITEVDSI